MVKPFARSSGMDILKYSRPPRATPSRWARRGPIRRILFNYLNRLRKKLISALIYFISFFSLLPTSPRNRCDRAPLTYPLGSTSRMIPPPSCLQFLVACCVKSSSGCRLRPRSDLFSYFFVASFAAPNDVKSSPPHVPPRSNLVTQPPPITDTVLWLVVVCFFIVRWPSTAAESIFSFYFSSLE